MSKVLSIFIAGRTKSQTRARVTVNGTYSSAGAQLKAWRAQLEAELLKAIRLGEIRTLEGPLKIDLTFYRGTPKRELWGQWCAVKPDRDNLMKPVDDIAQKVGLFKDDGQIADGRIRKLWCNPGEAGVYIHIEQLRPVAEQPVPDWLKK